MKIENAKENVLHVYGKNLNTNGKKYAKNKNNNNLKLKNMP